MNFAPGTKTERACLTEGEVVWLCALSVCPARFLGSEWFI